MNDAFTLDRPTILARLHEGEAGRDDGACHNDVTPAAVLVPLVERAEGITVLFTRRTDHLANHAGQISFPGGRAEEHDSDIVATALRETEEETGVAAKDVAVVGRLKEYVTITGFHITPIVGFVRPPLTLKPDPSEVAEIFEVPLSFLLNPANHKRLTREFEGKKRTAWAMPYKEYFIWGATAGILRNLQQILTRHLT